MNFQAHTIAVIDDDPRVLESLVNLLASYGYSAQSYISAEQFLQAGGPRKCSCIIADVEMPQMSGLGLLEHLKGSEWDVPMILITGKPSVRSDAFYRERGAIGFFRKPVDGDTLVELICSVCRPPKPDVN
jgi:FixJ family two-component response regulator